MTFICFNIKPEKNRKHYEYPTFKLLEQPTGINHTALSYKEKLWGFGLHRPYILSPLDIGYETARERMVGITPKKWEDILEKHSRGKLWQIWTVEIIKTLPEPVDGIFEKKIRGYRQATKEEQVLLEEAYFQEHKNEICNHFSIEHDKLMEEAMMMDIMGGFIKILREDGGE